MAPAADFNSHKSFTGVNLENKWSESHQFDEEEGL